MGVSVLAAGGPGYVAGQLAFDLGIPLIGLVCLIIGVLQSARRRRQPRPAYPAYPYPPRPPMGYQGAGYPGPYPPRPYPGYPPYAPPPRPTGNSGNALIIIGAVLLVFGIAGNGIRVARHLGAKHRAASSTSIQVGECITEKDYLARSFGSRPENNCTNPANTDELVYKSDSRTTCPDGKREHSLYDWFTDGSTILCFAMNLKQGDCYRAEGDSESPSLSFSDCNDSRPVVFKVVQRIDGNADKAACPMETTGISYPSPARTYCLARAGT
jgi:hypothetical protein